MLVIISLRALVLAIKISATWQIPIDRSFHWSWAAISSETDRVSAELLLALTHRESNFDPQAGPHFRWPKIITPVKKRHYICGPIQTTHYSPAECMAVRDPFVGYAAGVRQLTAWWTACRKLGSREMEVCMLNGFTQGWKGVINREIDYSKKILYDAKRLKNVQSQLYRRRKSQVPVLYALTRYVHKDGRWPLYGLNYRRLFKAQLPRARAIGKRPWWVRKPKPHCATCHQPIPQNQFIRPPLCCYEAYKVLVAQFLERVSHEWT